MTTADPRLLVAEYGAIGAQIAIPPFFVISLAT